MIRITSLENNDEIDLFKTQFPWGLESTYYAILRCEMETKQNYANECNAREKMSCKETKD